MSDSELWMLIAHRLRAELLPRAPCSGVWAGRGKSGTCGLCGLPIIERDVHCEAALPSTDGRADRMLLAHIDCHQFWIELSQIATYGPLRRHCRPLEFCVGR
jgi:hypothetical protein